MLTRAFCKKRRIEGGKALSACLERPPCKLRPSAVLAPSGQIACSEHAKCLCGARKMLVRSVQKPCSGLQEGVPALQKRLPGAARRVSCLLGSRFFRYFKCKDFAIRLPGSRLRVFASVFPHKPGGRAEKTDSRASGKSKCQNGRQPPHSAAASRKAVGSKRWWQTRAHSGLSPVCL